MHNGSVASNDSLSEIEHSDAKSTICGASHNATYSHASDIMSVDSTDYSQFRLKRENHENYDEVRSEGEMSSLDLGLTTDDGEYETQSDDTMTVDVESPEPSFAGISDDIEVDKVEDEGNDAGFEFVDVHNYF